MRSFLECKSNFIRSIVVLSLHRESLEVDLLVLLSFKRKGAQAGMPFTFCTKVTCSPITEVDQGQQTSA